MKSACVVFRGSGAAKGKSRTVTVPRRRRRRRRTSSENAIGMVYAKVVRMAKGRESLTSDFR